jgi:cytoskeleton protein RodZ
VSPWTTAPAAATAKPPAPGGKVDEPDAPPVKRDVKPGSAPKPEAPIESPPSTAPLTQQAVAAAVGSVTAPYRLVARTTAPTWLRVRTDDGRQLDETIPAGEVREWVSNRPFTLTIGNAGGLRLELNGRPLPALGGAGTVITRLVIPTDRP